jgi:hypothetical protein
MTIPPASLTARAPVAPSERYPLSTTHRQRLPNARAAERNRPPHEPNRAASD